MARRDKWLRKPVETQEKILQYLLLKAKTTRFGKDHGFNEISNYDEFKERVPLRDYEGLRDYVDPMVEGKGDILWPNKPMYLSKTSGTTSGAKYIPISKASMPFHIRFCKACFTQLHS